MTDGIGILLCKNSVCFDTVTMLLLSRWDGKGFVYVCLPIVNSVFVSLLCKLSASYLKFTELQFGSLVVIWNAVLMGNLQDVMI